MKNKIFIVHCIDTEGPLHESLNATFERLYEIYGIKLDATEENLIKLQNKKINLRALTNENLYNSDSIETDVAKSFSKHLLQLNDSWDKIDLMLDKIMSKQYRDQYLDSNGRGIIYNWHCMDHVGFLTNERKRDIGFGNIFNHYKAKNEEYGGLDSIHWHFHPLSFNKEAHISSTSYDNSYQILHDILSRRLIDNEWFPIVNRAGFHAIRQDSSFFLEQWIPFDYSNQAMFNDENEQPDGHRFGDWRRAPKEWRPYHPSYDDYQIPGNMNRFTTKCLNIGTREKLVDDFEIEMAFKDAMKSGSAILSFTNHDWRDMALDIDNIYSSIKRISKQYPEVSIINSDAVTAMQSVVYPEENLEKNKIRLTSEVNHENTFAKLEVNCENGEVFGSQPYLSIKTKDGRYYHDNLNEKYVGKTWEYIFDRLTVDLSAVAKISVAANDKYGNQSITSINLS